jgi:uncharacterized protein
MSQPTVEQRLRAREKPIGRIRFLQNWLELLFLHWVYDPEEIQALLPKGLYVDTYKGKGYIGVIPFLMSDIKPAFFGNSLSGISFYELNVRTYVYDDKGVPGVWFFSLDASSWLATKIGQYFFHLPYHSSTFKVIYRADGWIDYQCTRSQSKSASFLYRKGGLKGLASTETLEFFLLERYHFFAANKKDRLFRVSVHHSPYQIYETEVASWNQQPLVWNKLCSIDENPVHQMMTKGLSVDIYPIHGL